MKMQVVTCPNCNGEVQVDTSREFGFCSYCGTKILFSKDSPENATQAFKSNREAALDETQRIIDYFDPLSEEFEKLDMVNDQLNIMHNRNFRSYEVWCGILFLLGTFLFYIDVDKYGIFCYIGAAVAFGLRLLADHNNKTSIEEFTAERKRLSKLIIETYDACPHCPVGIEYCRPETLYDIYEYIRKGRAETIKEAINLLEAEEHNAEMMRIARNTKAISEANLEVNTINMINNVLK